MFDFVRTHTRILQFILVLLIFPSFVFFGIQGYSRLNEGGADVAKVDGRPITQAEWDAAHREQVDRVRRQMPNVDAKMFDTPHMRRNTLDTLVRDRVMLAAAERAGFSATDERLINILRTDPQFASFRNADGTLNKDALLVALSGQGMTLEGFERDMRRQIAVRQVLIGVNGTVLAPAMAASGALDAMFQQREVQLQRFDTKDYLSKVTPSAAEIEAYYKDPAHASQLQLPEKADIEYVVLDLDAVKKGVTVAEDDLRKYYTENQKRYTVPEERQANHILIKASADQPAEERAKAKAKAEGLLAEIQKTPASFADLARKNSQDAGSAEKGGEVDLFIARGDTDKAYEDALFALKAGELSPVVEAKDGFYILQLKTVRGGTISSFDTVRAGIEEELKKQMAQVKYTELTAEFNNLVYEQSDSLKPVVDKLKLELHTAKGVAHVPAAGATGPLASAKFLDVLFNAETLRSKRNTEATETAPNQIVSGRVISYNPAAMPPLADVTPRVREALAAQQAAALAHKEGEARVAELRKTPDAALTSPVQVVSRAQREVPRNIIDAALKAPESPLPAVIGVDQGDEGYVVVKLTKILGRDPVAADPKQGAAQYAQAWASAESQAYYAALKKRFKVDLSGSNVITETSASK